MSHWLGSAFLPPVSNACGERTLGPGGTLIRAGQEAGPRHSKRSGGPTKRVGRGVRPVRLSRVVFSNEQAMLASHGYGWSHSSNVVVTRPVSSADRSRPCQRVSLSRRFPPMSPHRLAPDAGADPSLTAGASLEADQTSAS